MKKLAFSLIGLALFACNSNSSNKETSADGHTQGHHCHYKYVEDSTSLEWTAYKTNEKIPVKGTFKIINVQAVETESFQEFLKGIAFEIPTNSVFSNNPDRDAKLFNNFFMSMDSTESIYGKVLKVEGDNSKGKIQFEVNMNGLAQSFWTSYNYKNNKLDVMGNLYLNDWKAELAVEAINTVCKDLHTGSDGVSKTWSEVGISIHAIVDEHCH